MFFSDGFVYGGQPTDIIKVTKVRVLNDRIMLVTFNNDEQRLFDSSVLDGEAFKSLDDKAVFDSVSIDHGVVTWLDGEIDCAPEYMYNNSYEYTPIGSADNCYIQSATTK